MSGGRMARASASASPPPSLPPSLSTSSASSSSAAATAAMLPTVPLTRQHADAQRQAMSPRRVRAPRGARTSAPSGGPRSNGGAASASAIAAAAITAVAELDEDDAADDEMDLMSTSPDTFYGSPGKRSSTTARSLNHLLNFTFAERPRVPPPPSSARARRPGQPYSKERYVNANFRFLVSPNQEYAAKASDPDSLLAWSAVEQAVAHSHSEAVCPICLSPPCAAKMTKCGHVFCWSCVLQYLALGERKWRRCPICYEAVYAADLRSVAVQQVPRYTEGETVTLRLLERSWASGAPELDPVRGSGLDDAASAALALQSDDRLRFHKVVRATAEQLRAILHAEARQLAAQYREAVQTGELDAVPYIRDAMQQLKLRAVGHRIDDRALAELDAFLNLEPTGVAPANLPAPAPGAASASRTGRELPLDAFPPLGADAGRGSRPPGQWKAWSDVATAVPAPAAAAAATAASPPQTTTTTGTAAAAAASANAPHDVVPAWSQSSSDGEASETESAGRVGARPNRRERRRQLGAASPQLTPSSPQLASASPAEEAMPALQLDDQEAPRPRQRSVSESSNSDASIDDPTERPPGTVHSDAGSSARDPSGRPPNAAALVFQADDAQRLYLHPLDMRILQREYSGVQRLPHRLTGRILQLDEITQSEEMRRRYKAFAHLPLSCEYTLVELDMAQLVSPATMQEFASELASRHRRRRSKEQQEQQRRRTAERSSQSGDVWGDGASAGAGDASRRMPLEDEWGPPLPAEPSAAAAAAVSLPTPGPSLPSYARAARPAAASAGAAVQPHATEPVAVPSRAPAWSRVAAGLAPAPAPAPAASDADSAASSAGNGRKGRSKTVLMSTGSLRRY